MQIRSLPISIPASEAKWVESESIRLLATKVLGTQTIAIGTMIFLFVLLYNHVPTPIWLTWFVLHGLTALTRVWFVKAYHARLASDGANEQTAFYLRHVYIVILIGFTWGSTVYLFNNKTPSMIEALCFNFILVYGIVTTIYLSSHLQSLNLFVLGYSTGFVGSTAARMLFNPLTEVSVIQGALFLSGLMLAIIMTKFGKQLNLSHINALRLQFRNEQLINSLTQEKQTALEAVTIKNRLIASTAHDMRQPVLALDLYANWLTEDPTLSTELTPKITAATRAVIALFDSMFDMAQLAQGQVMVNLEQVNLKTLLEDLCTQHQAVAKSKHLELRMRLLDAELLTDPLLLKRIVGNLISNAIKYTQTGGILVACRQTLHSFRIEVWDTGSGIAEEEQSLVFHEFYKSPAHAGTNDGFGLGLSIVTQLSDKLGYTLHMKSRPGRGTKMAIELLHPKPISLMS
ncbi:MAG: HAMP domain-containing sensor histidine kinase [Burkholderiaceae bacterium]|nr:HAMP domain-containing sensor histidine kinase [Burkholderiaceae bacterium]